MAAAKKRARRAKGGLDGVTVSVPPAIRRLIESKPVQIGDTVRVVDEHTVERVPSTHPEARGIGLVEALSAPPPGSEVLDLLGALEKSLGQPREPIRTPEVDAQVSAAIAELAPRSVVDGPVTYIEAGFEAPSYPLILGRAYGLHFDCPGAEYYARTLSVASKSLLDLVRQSPAHAHAWAHAKEERETPALAFGKALHCAILEPERFAQDYAVQPKMDGRTTEGKAARARWLEEHPGAKPLTDEDARTIGGMVASVHRHPMAAALLVDGAAEVTARWRDAATGVECKARADYWSSSISTLVDVKTTEDASPAAFQRTLANYGYHRQAAMYLDGWRAAGGDAESFVLVCIEKTPPYAVALYEPTFDAVMKGRSSIREDLETMARCQESGVWPGYSEEIEPLDLPRWATW